MKADGEEAAYVGASIQLDPPLAGLNFSKATVKVTLTDINLDGLAPPEKQVLVFLIGSDTASEVDATSYLRLCINGDGKVILSVPGEKKDGRNTDHPVFTRTVALPVKKLTLTIDRQGYTIEILDGAKPMTTVDKWGTAIDWTAWANITPDLVIKGVRRPSAGTCEATLGDLIIDSK